MKSFLGQLALLNHRYYIANIILSLVFFFVRLVPPFSYTLFETADMDMREVELSFGLVIIVAMKNRHVRNSPREYVSNACKYAKILSTALFLRQHIAYGMFYMFLWLLQFLLIPEPAYEGPRNVVYFHYPELDEELARDKRVTWLIEFYAPWFPACISFASGFEELAAKYTLPNLQFGKIDVSSSAKCAEKYRVDTSSWSRQLPTLILFEAGRESIRKPLSDKKGRTFKYVFTKENVENDFNLTELHRQCKSRLPSKKTSMLAKAASDLTDKKTQ